MDTTHDGSYTHVATLCHASQNTCPKVFVSGNAPEARRVMIEDDFGGKVFLSEEQLHILQGTEL